MKKFLIFFIWILSLIFTTIHFHENPELVEKIKKYFQNDKKLLVAQQEGKIFRKPGNSFLVEISEVITFSEKTAFVMHEEEILNFDINNLVIYFQNGFYLKNSSVEKINLPKSFTTEKNGGVKAIFIYKEKQFALISSVNKGCYYASIVLVDEAKEIFKTKCLPKKKIDYNGLGSSSIHYNEKIYLTIGAPEQASSIIRELAQDTNSFFGKIVEINTSNLDKIISGKEDNLEISIFTLGHRNPQGLTKINESIFSVEHGPKGGDELNKIIKNKNYGWPAVSYGTQYHYDENGKYYEVNHEENLFEEPLFALVPSVGISSLNACPSKLINYYKKPCLLALSLYGNSLRPGRSVIIYLLNKKMDKVHSIEKILLRDDLKLRHFVTNEKNEIYEDKEGNIYISADRKGIYKLSFVHFRN